MRVSFLPAILCAAFISASSLLSSAQKPSSGPVNFNAAAMQAYQAKDYASFLANEKRALQLAPENPRLLYNVACGEALVGNAAEAVRLLDQLLARKLDLGAENDADFSTIRQTPEWAAYEAGVAELRKPLVRSTVAFTLPDSGLLATGMAYDSRTGDTYIASVRERKILRRTKKGVVSDFIKPAKDGFLAGASLLLDPAGKLLYASTSAVPFMVGYRKEDFGRSGVFAFDLKSGKVLRKAMLAADGKQHFLNALALDAEGNLYVSDSLASGIYRLRRGSDTLEVFVPSDVFSATQGLAFSADNKTLYVMDFSDGLWAMDTASMQKRHLDAPADVYLAGLDGLSPTPEQDGFIAVQIGVQPARVLRLRLDPQQQRIASVEILEMAHPDYSEPIQGIVAGHEFLYVANSQLNLANGQSGAFAEERALPTVVLRLPL